MDSDILLGYILLDIFMVAVLLVCLPFMLLFVDEFERMITKGRKLMARLILRIRGKHNV
jgi:hypothetical protein